MPTPAHCTAITLARRHYNRTHWPIHAGQWWKTAAAASQHSQNANVLALLGIPQQSSSPLRHCVCARVCKCASVFLLVQCCSAHYGKRAEPVSCHGSAWMECMEDAVILGSVLNCV